MGGDDDLDMTAAQLCEAGCVAAREEAAALVEAAGGDVARLRKLVARRRSGEPLAWLTGAVRFCGETVLVCPGVFVPRRQSERLALEAVARLPEHGLAVDLCTGTWKPLLVAQPDLTAPLARVVASEIDPLAAACARTNGVEVFEGDMAASLPLGLLEQADVVTAVVPYVPTGELRFLARDVLAYEPRRALDGGEAGTIFLARAALEAAPLLRPGGSLLLELGGEEADLLEPLLAANGYREVKLVTDEEGDLRALFCRR